MKRPKFFEDLDRSLSGESEPERVAEPVASAQGVAAYARNAQQAAMAQYYANQTATGALLLAAEQRNYARGLADFQQESRQSSAYFKAVGSMLNAFSRGLK